MLALSVKLLLMTVYGGYEWSYCGRHKSIRGRVWGSINCPWELHLTCPQNLWHPDDIHCMRETTIQIIEFSLIVTMLDKSNAEEDSIQSVLSLINKDVQCVLLRHSHQSLQYVSHEAEVKFLTSWAITFVSSECDFVSMCKLSSLSPFLCRHSINWSNYCIVATRGIHFLTKMDVLCSPLVSAVSRCPT